VEGGLVGQEVEAAVAAELWTDLSAFNFELAKKEAQVLFFLPILLDFSPPHSI
jgi:hypothetical protein